MRSGDEIRELFNLKYNNLNSSQSPGFNDFEISMLLTNAQREVVDMYYTGYYHRNQSFEIVERVRKNISIITKEIWLGKVLNKLNDFRDYKVYDCPVKGEIVEDDTVTPYHIWRVLYENVTLKDNDDCINSRNVLVKPVRHDELDKILRNPFKWPTDFLVLRLDLENTHQLMSKYEITDYCVRYIDFPKPFIISDISDVFTGCNIEKYTDFSPCIFDSFVEDIIIDRAVQLATVSYKENSLQTQMAVNMRKE